MNVELELFTLHDKYILMLVTISILIFSVGLFVWLESLNDVSKIQLKRKNQSLSYVFLVILLILVSIFATRPFVEQKTIKVETILVEALNDENNLIKLEHIENTYYPTFNGSVISWYTRDAKDQKYLQSEEVIEIYYLSPPFSPPFSPQSTITLYELNDSRNVSIINAQKPAEYRGVEAQPYWYSLILVGYNLLIAIFAYPLYSMHKKYIKVLWKSQNIISTILLAIAISYIFMF